MKIKIKLTRQENAEYFQVKINDIVEVNFEEYVAAVVASEIGNSNLEACKAQAIAARTYAVHAGVLDGKVISDSSATAQAYRASRYNIKTYPNCIKAALDTEGQIITYNNKPANTVYSSCNGGRTVSCKEKWGKELPYLIEQTDPWDAISGRKKNGHGVGMSQVGAIQAGLYGISYIDILDFYYPSTHLTSNYGNKLELIYVRPAEILKLKQQVLEVQDLLKKIKEGL